MNKSPLYPLILWGHTFLVYHASSYSALMNSKDIYKKKRKTYIIHPIVEIRWFWFTCTGCSKNMPLQSLLLVHLNMIQIKLNWRLWPQIKGRIGLKENTTRVGKQCYNALSPGITKLKDTNFSNIEFDLIF